MKKKKEAQGQQPLMVVNYLQFCENFKKIYICRDNLQLMVFTYMLCLE